MALLNLFMINHRHFRDLKFGPVCLEKFSLRKSSNLFALETVFRVEGEIGYAYKILGIKHKMIFLCSLQD